MNVVRTCVAIALALVHLAAYAEPIEPFSFVQLADPQLGFGGYEYDVEALELAAHQINESDVDFVIVCGDLIHITRDQEALTTFVDLRKLFEKPVYAVPGNHDLGAPPTPKTLKRYREQVGDDYYAIDHKGVTFLLTNSSLWNDDVPEESEKHQAWYETELKRAKESGRPVVWAGHYPPMMMRIDEPSMRMTLPPQVRVQLLELGRDHGVVAYLAGHIHRNNVVEYEGAQIVASASTSRNTDGSPRGYRVWHVAESGELTHEYIPVQGAASAFKLKNIKPRKVP